MYQRCSRRDWLLGISATAALSRLRAAELSGFYYRDYSKCLPAYLSKLARDTYDKRNRALALLTSDAAVRERQAWARQTLWKLIGGEPERTPLNARVTGRLERNAYSIEKVIYDSRPGIVISANVYIPKQGHAPYPGVLFQMGHSALGKAYASYQKCCQGLAQLGFLVLAFDPMGQGERIGYPDSSGTDTRLAAVDDEHSLPGKQMLLIGDSATRFQLWDAMRSLDYLSARSDVDPKRLASTGQSGGGTLTMLLACADDRLSAAAISSGNTENVACADFDPPGSTDDAEQDLIGSGPEGFDRWDLLYPIAPKPLLVQVSAHDFFGTYSPRYLSDGGEEYKKLAGVYETLGKPECLQWRSTPLPHGLTYQLRLDIYNWFERWLNQSDKKIDLEPPVAPEEPRVLWTGPTGSVVRDHGSLRAIDLIRREAGQVARHRSPAAWTNVLRVLEPPSNLKMRRLAVTPLNGAHVAAIEVNAGGEVWIPAWLFTPAQPSPETPLLLALDDRGRNRYAHEDDLYHRLARAGQFVCAADLRGIGDMRPEVGRGNPAYTIPHDSEEEFAWASLILGTSLLAQRITDVVALATAIKNDPDFGHRPISLAARGSLTVPALFAFDHMREIASLHLSGGLLSFQNLLETEDYKETLANFGWKLFQATDLPLLAAQAAPRRIRIAGAVDGAELAVSSQEVRRVYASSNVLVSAAASWNETTLRGA